jgi:ABC-type glutathione transport system ATPase component
MTILLSVEHLTKQFPTRQGIVRAVEDVSFTVDSGETLALVGESGCGKTTVALSLLRLIRPNGGRVSFEGVDLGGGTDKAEKAWRQRLSIVFQNPYSSLDPRMRIRNIVGEPLVTAYGLRGRALTERVAKHLDEVGLGAEHLTRFPHEFSGGQRQRIAIARALALEPKLLILDEPRLPLVCQAGTEPAAGLQKNLGAAICFFHNQQPWRHRRPGAGHMGRVVGRAGGQVRHPTIPIPAGFSIPFLRRIQGCAGAFSP